MTITVSARFAFSMSQPGDVLLQFEAAKIPEQTIMSSHYDIGNPAHFARIPAQDDIGERIWIRAEGHYRVEYTADVAVQRLLTDIGGLDRLPPHKLPGEAVQYLFDSRYCAASRFQPFVDAEFGHLQGGPRILAMRDWIASHFAYVPGSSTVQTTAIDSFVERRGICRDYAHVMVALARASAFPARYVSVYDPGVTPQDFHAVAEVFLADPTVPGGGAWHIVDATGMADPAKSVKIGVGRDAADVSFMTAFDEAQLEDTEVTVREKS